MLTNVNERDVANLLIELCARLPELEWQLRKTNITFLAKSIPKHLFRQSYHTGTHGYITEIESDITRLKDGEFTPQIGYYLGSKINQKISTLVAICNKYVPQRSTKECLNFGLNSLGTRAQWIDSLESTIHSFIVQQSALNKRLDQATHDVSMTLTLKHELGELEKQLTGAREVYQKATGHDYNH